MTPRVSAPQRPRDPCRTPTLWAPVPSPRPSNCKPSAALTDSSEALWNRHTERKNLCLSTSADSWLALTSPPRCSSLASLANASSAEQMLRWMCAMSFKGGRAGEGSEGVPRPTSCSPAGPEET